MKSALSRVLTVASLLLPAGLALADGPYDQSGGQYGGDYGGQDPGYGQQDPNPQPYQPPPEGTCLDDNQQATDCSTDTDYASYSQIDDGYDPNAYQDFHSTLAPYGNWVNSEQYGQVWVPSAGVVGSDFTPYYHGGHWSMTDYGWTWVSDYNWGWAPFHYGRWVTLGGHGWSWVPGRIWGPAWVHWRTGGGYVGWAALPPRGVRISAPLYGGYGGGYGGRFHSWNFVPMAQITAPRLVRVAPGMTYGIYGRTSISSDLRSIGNTRIVYGPSLHHFAGAGIQIAPMPLHSLQMAMPRSGIVVRAGVPLASRPYYAPAVRSMGGGYGRPLGAPAPGYSRPGYPQPSPGYGHPGYQAPGSGYQRPGYPQPSPGYQGHPGYPQPSPGYQQHPGYPAPSPGYQQHPNYPQPSPGYQQHPGYPQPGSGYQHPGYPQPSPGNQPHPGYPQPNPGYPQHPNYPSPSPGNQPHPGYGQPNPGYSHPGSPPAMPQHQQPSYQQPSYQQPSYRPPAYSPPPQQHQAPSYQAPAYHAPAAPAYHAAPPPSHSAPAAPSHSAPAPSGGHHR